jgi:type IV secretion system protein VirD4
LGTATELRAQRNYAGHRLAPWLGHVMVSRQETARPLLTPGEVMQLPPDDAVVMLSGHPPIKATKLRYFTDANFVRRVLPPPALLPGLYADAPQARPDDWSVLATPAIPASHLIDGGFAEADDGGPRRQPELAQTVAASTDTEQAPSDLVLLDDDGDPPNLLPSDIDPRLQGAARLAVLDPDDGIPL